jgi:cellulose synthase/poly-beta-1,6-N-acetylglucosamine synthase-like glycosyltransferase
MAYFFSVVSGPYIWSKVLFIFCFIVIAALFLCTLFTLLYQKFIYKKFISPSFDPSYKPKCTVIVPCKGNNVKNFEENLKSFLKLDYENYDVIFTVESEYDDAVKDIKKVISQNPDKAFLSIAGLSSSCGQKNYNLIAAVNKAKDSDVYVFADIDISPQPNWLSEIILPLSKKEIIVATGFRWLKAEKGTIGNQAHFYMNSFLYTLYSTASFFGGVGIWGGTMAIRREDFEELEVHKRWAETVVDDSSLSQLVKKKKKKSILVPTCITHTDDLIEKASDAVRWFERQMMFLKLYQRSLWVSAMPIILITFLTIIWLPLAVVLSFSTHYSFWQLAGGSSLLLLFGKLSSDMIYPFLGCKPNMVAFIFFQPVSLCLFLFSCIKTTFRRVIKWSGIKYYLSFRGKVIKLERMQ